MGKIRVLITEEYPLIRENVRAILGTEKDIEIVGEAASLPEMMARVNQSRPDVILLNVTVGEGNHPGILRQIKALYPAVKIMAVTMADRCEYFFEVPRPGASSYLVKSGSPAEFLTALKELAHDSTTTASGVTTEVLSKYARHAETRLGGNGIRLTNREKQILALTADGYSNGEIALRLSLKPSTVRTHRASIMTKLGLPNRTDLVKYALARGYVSVGSHG